MTEQRTYLKIGTKIQLDFGNTYEIIGDPIGFGGGSIIYPAEKIYECNGEVKRDGIIYALKECYPVTLGYEFTRNEYGEIIPKTKSDAEISYLQHVKQMQFNEKRTTQKIYQTGFRLLPVLESSNNVTIFLQGITPQNIQNTFTVMESLSTKGHSLTYYIKDHHCFTPLQTFYIIQQLLFNLREIHNANFLHLDISAGNIFIKGTLDDESNIITLIDFGSARELFNGRTEVISDRAIFTTLGFSAPEILFCNDGTLRLGPEADIYSVGCLIFYLLTGSRYNVKKHIKKNNGKYLTSFNLRKISCPKHLIEKMQEIIAHALAYNPEERYHSTEEMLEDVTDFVKLLQPYRSTLNSISFDAFICYKHGPIDSIVATTLQQQLEHFRSPHKISGKKHPFKRIFVDEGELSSCADFGEQIRAAIKNSEWLIVICSKETPSSLWVEQEINIFLEYHDRSRILAVITDGEPKECYPPQLLGNSQNASEVFAADARGISLSEIIKKTKKDVLLKIAAPMLNTNFDTLKQRVKTYRFQRAFIITTISLFFLMLLFIHEYQKNQQIFTELQNTLISQSRYLSKLSGDLLEEGDRVKAIQLALAALPDGTDDKSRPLIPEALYALNNATYSYWRPSSNNFIAECKLETDTKQVEGSVEISPNNAYLLTVDTSGKLYLFDAKTNICKTKLLPTDIIPNITNNIFYGATFLTNEKIILFLSDRIVCWNFSENTLLWNSWFTSISVAFNTTIAEHLNSDSNIETYLDIQKGKLYLFADFDHAISLYVINTNNGKLLKHFTFTDESDESYWNNISLNASAMAVSISGESLVLGISCARAQADENDEPISLHDHKSLLVVNITTGNIVKYECEYPDIYAIQFIDSNKFVVLSSILQSTYEQPEPWSYALECFSCSKTTSLWNRKEDAYFQIPSVKLSLEEQTIDDNYDPQTVIIATFGNQISFYDPNKGKRLSKVELSTNLISTEIFDDEFNDELLLTLSDGSIYMLTNCSNLLKLGKISGDFSCAKYLPDETSSFGKLFLFSTNDPSISVMNNSIEDRNYKLIEDGDCFDYEFFHHDKETYGIIIKDEQLTIYKELTDSAIASTVLTDDDDVSLLDIKTIDNDTILYYISDNTLFGFNIEKNDIIFETSLPSLEDFDSWEYLGWYNSNCIILQSNYDYYLIIDILNKNIPQKKFCYSKDSESTRTVTISNNGKYFAEIIEVSNNDLSSDTKLVIYDLENEQWLNLSNTLMSMDISSPYLNYNCNCLEFSPDGSCLAIVSKGKIQIIDMASQTITQTLDIDCFTQCDFHFYNDNILAVLGDSGHLITWNLYFNRKIAESETILSKDNFFESINILDDGYISYTMRDSDFAMWEYIYQIDSVGNITPYLTLKDASIDISSGNILFLVEDSESNFIGYYQLYDLDSLIIRAKELINNQTLTNADLKKYFIE